MMCALARFLAAGLLGLVVSQVTAAEQIAIEQLLDSGFPRQGELRLTPKRLVRLTLALNAEVLHAARRMKVTEQMLHAEQALYTPTIYATYTYEDRERERTSQEIQSSIFSSQTEVLVEQVNRAEVGVRGLLPTGAEVSLGYRITKRENNLIDPSDPHASETQGALTFSIRQPLLRGRGPDVTETDLRVAKLERKISKLQYQRQLLKSLADSISVYWNLYRAHAVLEIRRDALENARRIMRDVQRRVAGGRMAGDSLLEARITVANREAEVARAEQLVHQAEARIKSLLGLSGAVYRELHFQPARPPITARISHASFAERYRRALEHWPSYRIAQLRLQQELVRLNYADNQRLPVLDLVAGYSSTSLDRSTSEAFEDVFQNDYPEWHVGLVFEMPLWGGRAESEYHAQRLRVQQARLKVQNIRSKLSNDLRARWQQLGTALDQVRRLQKEVELRARLLASARKRFERGQLRLGQLIEREDELNRSRKRLVESAARLELARVALLLAESRLLERYDIEWSP